VSNQKTNYHHTAGKVTGATGADTCNDGGFVSARTGAGLYTINPNEALDATQRVTKVTPRAAAAAFATVADTSDTVIGVNMFNGAGAATDTDFDFEV